MENLGIIILSRLWPKASSNPNHELFCKKEITINGHNKTCLKIKNKPIIGIHEDDVFPPSQYDWNKGLVECMFKEISNGIDTLFLALHDKHILNNNVTHEKLFQPTQIGINLRNFSGTIICVLFQHEDHDVGGNQPGIYKILKSHLDNANIGRFNPKGFIEAIQKYINTVVKKKIIDEAHLLRSQILTPFVALHLALQMENGEIKVFCNMTDEERKHCKESCEKGLELLGNNGEELKAKFMELIGLPPNVSENEKRIKSQPEKELDEFIGKYKDRLCTIFEGLSVNNTFVLNENENVDNLLAGIEQLSKIVEEGISCKEAIKKNRVLRHNIENAITRLGLFTAPFSDKREGLRKELNDLKVNLSSFDTDIIRKYFNKDMKDEFDNSIKLIQGYNKADSDDEISNMIKELISSLQKIVTVTLNIAPR